MTTLNITILPGSVVCRSCNSRRQQKKKTLIRPLHDNRLSLTSQMGCNCLINPMFVSFYAFSYGLFSLHAISSADLPSPWGVPVSETLAAWPALLCLVCGVILGVLSQLGRKRQVFISAPGRPCRCGFTVQLFRTVPC